MLRAVSVDELFQIIEDVRPLVRDNAATVANGEAQETPNLHE